MRIVGFEALRDAQLEQAARILRDAIPGPSYKDAGDAEAEVASFLDELDRFAFAAIDGAGESSTVLGWIGGVRGYTGSLELHPLVVDPIHQGQGVGRALVAALEAAAIAQGFLAMHLGADDEVGGTNLFGADLFPDALAKLAEIEPTERGHPFFFYRRLGFEPVGLIPDANGFGKPDILMSKRLRQP